MSAVTTYFPPGQPIYRLSVEQYHKMIQDGVLTDDDPVELVEGVLIYKISKNPAHSTAAALIEAWIRSILGPGWHCRFQEPITLTASEPEPDAVIVSGSIQNFRHRHPVAEEVLLLIEIADSTLDRDRSIKLRAYARAGISCYWIVNLTEQQIEIYTQPDSTAAAPTYLQKQIYKRGERAPYVIGQTSGSIFTSNFFPD